MQRFARIFATAIPLAILGSSVSAEDVVIRLEAKRSSEAATEAAQGWGESFPDIVTFPLSAEWIAIGIGPMPREAAEPMLKDLQDRDQIPADSFLAAAAGHKFTTLAPAADAAEEADQTAAAGSPSLFAPEAANVVQPEPEPAPLPEGFYIRIDSNPDLAKGEESLATRRETLPDAGLWKLPNGRFSVAIGPMPRDAADQWLAAFRAADAAPRDAFVAAAAEMGEVVTEGATPDIGQIIGSETPATPMPPLEDVQRALRWAGHYDGGIDGKDGPMTRAAIAHEVVALRASPDAGTAMNELIRRRAEWRDDIGLQELQDIYTGLSLPAPMDRLQFDRNERALSIYGPKDGSGAALILFSQAGGQQEMLDLLGLVTALGWVPSPERRISQGSAILSGQNETHIGYAEAQVVDGNAQGFVLIWPVADRENQSRIAAEMSDHFARFDDADNLAAFTAIDARSGAETEPAQPAAPAAPDTSQ